MGVTRTLAVCPGASARTFGLTMAADEPPLPGAGSTGMGTSPAEGVEVTFTDRRRLDDDPPPRAVTVRLVRPRAIVEAASMVSAGPGPGQRILAGGEAKPEARGRARERQGRRESASPTNGERDGLGRAGRTVTDPGLAVRRIRGVAAGAVGAATRPIARLTTAARTSCEPWAGVFRRERGAQAGNAYCGESHPALYRLDGLSDSRRQP